MNSRPTKRHPRLLDAIGFPTPLNLEEVTRLQSAPHNALPEKDNLCTDVIGQVEWVDLAG